MLKILIISKNLKIAKTIINKILYNIENLKIVSIANNFNEAEYFLKDSQPELIITTEIEVAQFIREKFINYFPGIIFILKSTNVDIDYKNKLILNNRQVASLMKKNILLFIKNTITLSRREKAATMLVNLGFDFKLNGTVYLLDSILYAHTYKGSFSFEQLKRDIYTYVSELNNTTADRVKWSISRSINYMYKRHNKESYEIVERYLKVEYPVKPTPKLIVSIIANTLDL